MSVLASDEVPTTHAWTGRHEFQAWKLEIQSSSMSVKIEWIPKDGHIIHNRIQMEVNPAIAATAAGMNECD